MSTPAEIISALQTQLKAAAVTGGHLSYIDPLQILIGAREGLADFPAICIERESQEEKEFAYPQYDEMMKVVLIAIIKTEDKDQQLIGTDGTTKGTLDVENDIKLTIDSDKTLGGKAIDVNIEDTVDGIIEFPVRSINIRMTIWFRQTRAVRT